MNAVNDPPVADPTTYAMYNGASMDIELTAHDVDDDPLTYEVVDPPENGSLSGIAPHVVYTPNAGFNGFDTFTFKANDGALDSEAAKIAISVDNDSAVNTTPVAYPQTISAVRQPLCVNSCGLHDVKKNMT